MTDPLGEALAATEDEFWYPNEKIILAAARNWQTLTNPSDELLDRVADLAGERNGFWQIPPVAAAYIAAVVDALTVTAEEDK